MARPLPSPMARMAQARTSRMEALDQATANRLQNESASAIARYIAQYHPSNQIEFGGEPQMFAEQAKDQAQARMGGQLMGHYQQMERQLLGDDLTRERMEEEYRLRDLVRRRAHWRGRGSKKERKIARFEKYQSIATAEGNSAKGKAATKKSLQMVKGDPWLLDQPRAIDPAELPRAERTPFETSIEMAREKRAIYSGGSSPLQRSAFAEKNRLRRAIIKAQTELEDRTKFGSKDANMKKVEAYSRALRDLEARFPAGASLTSSVRPQTQTPTIREKVNPQTGQRAVFNPQTNSWDIL